MHYFILFLAGAVQAEQLPLCAGLVGAKLGAGTGVVNFNLARRPRPTRTRTRTRTPTPTLWGARGRQGQPRGSAA